MAGARLSAARGPASRQTVEFAGALIGLVGVLRERYNAAADAVGLTPQQAMLLLALTEPRSMRAVADVLLCDRSNITGLVNRLEARGFVSRMPDPHDGRVKLLVPTAEGARLRERFERQILADMVARVEAIRATTDDLSRFTLALRGLRSDAITGHRSA